MFLSALASVCRYVMWKGQARCLHLSELREGEGEKTNAGGDLNMSKMGVKGVRRAQIQII